MAPRPCLICARAERSYAVSAETSGTLGDGADPLRAPRQTAACVRHTTARNPKGRQVDPAAPDRERIGQGSGSTLYRTYSTSVSLRSEGRRTNRLSDLPPQRKRRNGGTSCTRDPGSPARISPVPDPLEADVMAGALAWHNRRKPEAAGPKEQCARRPRPRRIMSSRVWCRFHKAPRVQRIRCVE